MKNYTPKGVVVLVVQIIEVVMQYPFLDITCSVDMYIKSCITFKKSKSSTFTFIIKYF